MTTINIKDLLRHNLGNSITAVPCSIDLEELLDFNDLNECELVVHDLLEQQRQIAVIWCVEDVQSVRPDLNDDDAWQVLRACHRRHDCEIGFTWLFIEAIADDLFPASREGARS